jgi:hypothetical protein
MGRVPHRQRPEGEGAGDRGGQWRPREDIEHDKRSSGGGCLESELGHMHRSEPTEGRQMRIYILEI